MTPSEEELAAIVAAIEVAWPRPVVLSPAVEDAHPWRFSGRWWSSPLPARRERPFRKQQVADGPELTTVADDGAVLFDGAEAVRLTGLNPDRAYEHEGVAFRTLPWPPGRRLATIATVNDVHFGETWAEYRVFEGGVLQVHHRIATPEAVAWSEGCRAMITGFYPEYAFGRLPDRCFPVWPR